MLDTVGVFGPSNTNTIRYGLNTSLLWNFMEGQTVQLAYTLDYGIHRQTGQASFLAPDGSPIDPFGGYRDIKDRVLTNDGTVLRTRDRQSHAILNQAAVDYEGDFLDDTLHASAGARLPIMTRDLNQHCYLEVLAGSSNTFTPGVGFPECTTQAPMSTINTTNNTVTLAGFGNLAATCCRPRRRCSIAASCPISASPIRPSARSSMVVCRLGDRLSRCCAPIISITAAITATAWSAPPSRRPTWAAYLLQLQQHGAAGNLEQLRSRRFRYSDDLVISSITVWNNQFKNRIVTSFDPDQGISIDRNIGSVNADGMDAEINLFPFEGFSTYTSVSYLHARVSNTPDVLIYLGATHTQSVNLAGKEVVETPNWTVSERLEYKIWGFNFGLGAKYVGRRYATDTNDLRVPSYVRWWTPDISYDLTARSAGRMPSSRSTPRTSSTNSISARSPASRCFVPNVAGAPYLGLRQLSLRCMSARRRPSRSPCGAASAACAAAIMGACWPARPAFFIWNRENLHEPSRRLSPFCLSLAAAPAPAFCPGAPTAIA